MSEGVFTLMGSLIGFFGAVYAAKVGRNKDLTEANIKSAIEGADRNVYKEVEQLNRQLKKDLSDENIKHQNMWEQKKIDADLVAKARIEWIQNVRLIETEFVNNINLFLSYSASIIVIAEKTKSPSFGKHEIQLINQHIQNSTNCLFKAKKEKVLLKLYFGTNVEDNELVGRSKQIVDNIDKIYKINDEIVSFIEDEQIVRAEKKYDSVISLIEKVNDELEIFVLKARDYNKLEWERAKKGE